MAGTTPTVTRRVPIAGPLIGARERELVLAALDAGEVSSMGPFVRRFERDFAGYVGMPHAVATASGTGALHVALAALGIGRGDEVIVPALTFIATANAVAYCGATPVLCDVDAVHGNLDPAAVDAHISANTRGIIVVHLYGHPVEFDTIAAIAARRGLWIVEDAAEAHGAEYDGRKAGALAPVSIFSFYGNKIITTGDGGMVLARDEALAGRMRVLRDHGMTPGRRYHHEILGFNYRMTNLQAALGVAQLERLDEFVLLRRRVADTYARLLSGVPGLRVFGEEPWAKSAHWMTSIELDPARGWDRDRLMSDLDAAAVDTRPFFIPLSQLPLYQEPPGTFPRAERLGRDALSLPSGAMLTDADLEYVAATIRACTPR
jgi:perosamine synthetase